MRSRGFTLVEMMVGVLILGGALMAFLQALIGCMNLNVANTQITLATNDAQYVLEQIKELDYSSCIALDFPSSCYAFPTFNNLTGEIVEHSNVEIVPSRLRQVTIRIKWTDKQKQREVSLGTYFSP